VGDLFGLQEYGYVFPKHSRLLDPFSSAIAKTRTWKWTDELESKYLDDGSASCEKSAGIATKQIDEGPFVGIGALILAVSISAAMSRCCFRKRREVEPTLDLPDIGELEPISPHHN
jgi:hypothetical protein